MKKIETKLPGVYIIEPDIHGDARGYFMEIWSTRNFEELGLHYDFVQDNQSFSSQKGILRGLHFQNEPMAQAKLVRVNRGAVMDVAVDLRKGSPTYKQWEAVELSAEKPLAVWIPAGFGHAFLSLEKDTVQFFAVDQHFVKEYSKEISYLDPEIGLKLPCENPVLSEADRHAPFLREL